MTRLSRPIAVLAIGVVVVLLGTQQLASIALLSPSATTMSLPRVVPQSVGFALAAVLGRSPLPAAFTEPLQVVVARRLLAEGRADAASRTISRLRPSADRSDLLGAEAAATGENDRAAADFIEAGDAERLTPIIEAIAAKYPRRAIVFQQRLIHRLERERLPSPEVADAYWKLGVLEAVVGYVGSPPERVRANAESRLAYERAVRLAPASVKYLLSLANQEANGGARAAAIATFRQIVVLDPHGTDAPAGLRRLGVTP